MIAIDEVEISSIQSRDEIRIYFKDVSDLFIGIQNTRTSILSTSGFESTEYDSIIKLEKAVNAFLLIKMREYLSIHPYPTRKTGDTITVEGGMEGLALVSQDALASRTLIKIFVKAEATPENLDLNQLYFPRFYVAYKSQDVYSGDLWNLLYEMYRYAKGTEYRNFEHSEEEQIEIMIDELGLSRKPSF